MTKIEKTKKELNDGLKAWVSIWHFYRKQGRISHVKDMKNNIDRVIKLKDLDSNTVYFCYGNPDVDKETYARAEKQEMVF